MMQTQRNNNNNYSQIECLIERYVFRRVFLMFFDGENRNALGRETVFVRKYKYYGDTISSDKQHNIIITIKRLGVFARATESTRRGSVQR